MFWLIIPFVFPQALWVRRTAPRFAGAAGRADGSVGKGPPVTLYAVGDSIIAGVGANDMSRALVAQTAEFLATGLDAEVQWHAYGEIGANAGKVIREGLSCLPAKAADAVVLSVGVNDVTSLETRARFRANLTGILSALKAHSAHASIVVIGVPPLDRFPLLPQPLRAVLGLRARALDDEMRQVTAVFPRVIYLPIAQDTQPQNFSADGYHPSEASYRELGRVIAAALVGSGIAQPRGAGKAHEKMVG